MSNKRVSVAPERYVSWKEGDKHAPMAVRRRKQLNKAMKVTELAYSKLVEHLPETIRNGEIVPRQCSLTRRKVS